MEIRLIVYNFYELAHFTISLAEVSPRHFSLLSSGMQISSYLLCYLLATETPMQQVVKH